MQDLKVSLIQTDQIWEDKSANFSMYERYFNQITETDIIVLPEMFHTGFSMSVDQLAEDWQDSSGIEFLKKWSNQLQSAIYTSLIIREAGKFFNRGVFVFPDGTITWYDKRKSFGLGGEDKYYTAGNKEVIIEWKGWKINLQICYDLRFPELIRNRMENKKAAYDVLLYVANWPKKRISHWDALLRARAIENQCYVIGVNRVGTDGNGLVYTGHSQAIDMFGGFLIEPSSLKAEFYCSLNNIDLKTVRRELPFLEK
jgi:predicted amidohydrolase